MAAKSLFGGIYPIFGAKKSYFGPKKFSRAPFEAPRVLVVIIHDVRPDYEKNGVCGGGIPATRILGKSHLLKATNPAGR